MMEVAPGIHRLAFPFGGREAYCYVLVGDRVLVADSGLDSTPGEVILPYLESIGVAPERIRFVVSTHADLDHTGGNGALLEAAPNALLLGHEADRKMIEDVESLIADRYDSFREGFGYAEPEETGAWVRDNARHVPVDLTLVGGERIRLAENWWIEVRHTPGHSAGHLSLIDSRSRVAIIADAALGESIPALDGSPAMPPTYRFVDAYLDTLDGLARLQPELVLSGHFPVMDSEQAQAFLAASRGYVDVVEETLREELAAASDGVSATALIEGCGPRLGSWPEAAHAALIFPLAGHLERMLARGEATRQVAAEAPVWRLRR